MLWNKFKKLPQFQGKKALLNRNSKFHSLKWDKFDFVWVKNKFDSLELHSSSSTSSFNWKHTELCSQNGYVFVFICTCHQGILLAKWTPLFWNLQHFPPFVGSVKMTNNKTNSSNRSTLKGNLKSIVGSLCSPIYSNEAHTLANQEYIHWWRRIPTFIKRTKRSSRRCQKGCID